MKLREGRSSRRRPSSMWGEVNEWRLCLSQPVNVIVSNDSIDFYVPVLLIVTGGAIHD